MRVGRKVSRGAGIIELGKETEVCGKENVGCLGGSDQKVKSCEG